MTSVLRRCGRTHCPPGQDRGACAIDQYRLNAVPSTLLIPLAARAYGWRSFPWLGCKDADAAHLLSCLNADVSAYLADRPTVLNVLWRTQVIKRSGQNFFRRHRNSLGVCLGSGLSNHFQWFDNGSNRWLDADLPQVMALREELLPASSLRRGNAAVDVSLSGWWERLGLPGDRSGTPVWVLCEGVLMYLEPAQVGAVFSEFAENAPPGSEFVFDVISHFGLGRVSDYFSVKRTGAEFRWGIRSEKELASAHPRLRLLQSRSVAECYGGGSGLLTEFFWRPWLGASIYGMASLGV